MNNAIKLIITTCFILCLVNASAQTEVERRAYIEKYAPLAISQQQKYGIPASITLAQGILESGSGKSRLAIEANNHFGIKCKEEWTGGKIYHDDDELQECFRAYASAEESYIDHSLFLTTRPRYANLFKLDITDYKGWAHGLKDAGYATNPVYAESLIKIIDDYNLYDFDTYAQKPKETKRQRRKRTADELKAIESIYFDPDALSVSSKNSAVPLTDGIDIDNHYVALFHVGKFPLRINNNCRYIIMEKGDSMNDVAKATGISVNRLRKLNDLTAYDNMENGGIIYIDRKKNSYTASTIHIVQQGETLHDISQYYAIKLDKLKKMNASLKNELIEGDEISLCQTN